VSKFLPQRISRNFRVDVPEVMQSMDEYLGWILPRVTPWSEDLRESAFFLNTRWLEISDQDDQQEALLHIFLEDGRYLYSIDGNIIEGRWMVLEGSNTFICEQGSKAKELFDLAFLNRDFFILKKHGDQTRRHKPSFLVLGREPAVSRLTWRESMELLLNVWRNSPSYLMYIVIVGAAIALILAFSLLG
jgi:hypothetical protein